MRKYRVLLALAALPAAYVTGAFVAADWNISNWDVFGRYSVAVWAWLAVGLIATYP